MQSSKVKYQPLGTAGIMATSCSLIDEAPPSEKATVGNRGAPVPVASGQLKSISYPIPDPHEEAGGMNGAEVVLVITAGLRAGAAEAMRGSEKVGIGTAAVSGGSGSIGWSVWEVFCR